MSLRYSSSSFSSVFVNGLTSWIAASMRILYFKSIWISSRFDFGPALWQQGRCGILELHAFLSASAFRLPPEGLFLCLLPLFFRHHPEVLKGSGLKSNSSGI